MKDKRGRLGRRDVLKLAAVAAGAAACRGGIIRTAPILRGPGPDYAAEATKAYEESLKALRRTGVTPAGAEAAESGSGRLSLGPDGLRAHRNSRPSQPDFDVLIIGSGYGGAVCAARLAAQRKPGVKIGVLERGQEWVPGTFPFALANFSPFSRQASWLRQRLSTNPLGLFGFHNQGDMTVVSASGLGGASLINCAVVIETVAARRPSRDRAGDGHRHVAGRRGLGAACAGGGRRGRDGSAQEEVGRGRHHGQRSSQ